MTEQLVVTEGGSEIRKVVCVQVYHRNVQNVWSSVKVISADMMSCEHSDHWKRIHLLALKQLPTSPLLSFPLSSSCSLP